jgi:hypothetical protein
MVGLCAGRPSEWMMSGRAHDVVAICDWYVAPDHEGKLLGRRLIRKFAAPGRMLYAFSISDVAADYLNRLGWVGPYASSLLVLPLPRLARLLALRRRHDLQLHEHDIGGGEPLGALAGDLDRIEARRAGHARAHMKRGAAEWAWRLSVCGERRYRFGVARRGGEPAGYVVVRRMTPGSSRLLGRLDGAIVTDLVAVDDDPAVLRALATQAVDIAAELRVAALLMATSVPAHGAALAATGFLSPQFPLLGRRLASRAPVFMWLPQGAAAGLRPDAVEITFADADVDLAL